MAALKLLSLSFNDLSGEKITPLFDQFPEVQPQQLCVLWCVPAGQSSGFSLLSRSYPFPSRTRDDFLAWAVIDAHTWEVGPDEGD